MGTQQASIFETVRARAATAYQRNRAELQPLLQTAALHEAKGQATEARTLYTKILAEEPDWPEALHASFWFHVDQGDVGLVRATLAEARQQYDEAHRLAQHLTTIDSGNTQWQRDLYVSYWRLADVAEQRKAPTEARAYGKQAYDMLSNIDKRGLHLSPDDRRFLATLREKVRAGTQ